MADNVAITAGTGTTIGTDEVTIGGILQHVQRVKLIDGTDGGINPVQVGTSGGLSVKGAALTAVSGAIAAAATGTVGPMAVSEAGNVTFVVKNTTAASPFAGNPVLVFEQSDDNVSWAALTVVHNATNIAASTFTLTPNTANGAIMFDASVEGVTHVRVRVTAAPATNGMTIVIQAGGMPFSPVVTTMEGGNRATYRAATTAVLVAAASTAPFLVIYGSATKTIRVQNIVLSGLTLSAIAYLNVVVGKYSTQPTVGTATVLNKVAVDSQLPASTAALVQGYTAAPTAGTLVGAVTSRRNLGQAATPAAAGIPENIEFDFTNGKGNMPIVLRGTAEGLGVYFATAPASAVSMMAKIEWTEE